MIAEALAYLHEAPLDAPVPEEAITCSRCCNVLVPPMTEEARDEEIEVLRAEHKLMFIGGVYYCGGCVNLE